MLGFRKHRDKKAILTTSFTFIKNHDLLNLPKILGKTATAEIP